MRPIVVLVLSPTRLVMVELLDLAKAPADVYAWLSRRPLGLGDVTEGDPGEVMFCVTMSCS